MWKLVFSCEEIPAFEFSCASGRAPEPSCWELMSCCSTSLCEQGSVFHFEQDRDEGSWGTSPMQLCSPIQDVTSAEHRAGRELQKFWKFGALHIGDAISRFRMSFAEDWCKSIRL